MKISSILLNNIIRENLNVFVSSLHVLHIIQKGREGPLGLYHLSDGGEAGLNVAVLLVIHGKLTVKRFVFLVEVFPLKCESSKIFLVFPESCQQCLARLPDHPGDVLSL